MKNHDVETIKIELSYHSGAIFKKIVKFKDDPKKHQQKTLKKLSKTIKNPFKNCVENDIEKRIRK